MTDQLNPQSVETNSETFPQPSASFGKVPHDAEAFGKVRKDSESFGNIPNPAEAFRNVPKPSERKENHTLTVREVARMFEAAGVARTERSIVNWCQPNRQGVARLDCYFDTNEHKYFITAQSVESAIAEEKARATKTGHEASEPVGSVPKASDTPPQSKDSAAREDDLETTRAREKEILDLKILNGGKDFLIDQLRKEREGFIEQIVSGSRKIGQLETELRQLSAPRTTAERESSPRRESIEHESQ